MSEFSQKYPRYCKLIDVKDEYKYLIETSCGKNNCEFKYIVISDFNIPAEQVNSFPQVLFTAGMHGDEVLGPNVIMNLIEYLLQKNEEDETITNLIKSRYLIFFPMINPSGYFHTKHVPFLDWDCEVTCLNRMNGRHLVIFLLILRKIFHTIIKMENV